MNCEHVKELLSMYLDNKLALEDRQSIACHLHFCTDCSTLFLEFRRFDVLLSRLPRVEPRRSLEERIFSSTEYKELNGTWGRYHYGGSYRTPSSRRLRDDPSRPRLVSIPGGRLSQTSEVHNVSVLPRRRRWLSTVLRVVHITITVSILLALGGGCIIGWRLWQKQLPIGHNMLAYRKPICRRVLFSPGFMFSLCTMVLFRAFRAITRQRSVASSF